MGGIQSLTTLNKEIDRKMDFNSKIYVAGHRGLVGSAILKNLEAKGYTNIITRTHNDLDLKDYNAVGSFFENEKPEYVFLAAAKVGGIMANNTYRAQFIFENLQIQNNIIHHSYLNGVKKLLFLGSSCVYPKAAPQPLKEEYLLTDVLEYTNEPYAVAKIAGMKMCEAYNLQYNTNFISVMPTNLFGPNDNFHLKDSHVLPALLRKMHLGKLLESGNYHGIRNNLLNDFPDASRKLKSDEDVIKYLEGFGIHLDDQSGNKEVTLNVWGSGMPLREFLWSDDMADACVYLMEKMNFNDLVNINDSNGIRNSHVNIGWGKEITIKDLVYLIKEIVDFKGRIAFDSSKPDGTMRKLLDVSKLTDLGWKPKVNLSDGVKELYKIYLTDQNK